MLILIIVAIVGLILILKFLKKHQYLIKFVIKAYIGIWIWVIVGVAFGDILMDDNKMLAWLVYYIIAVVAFYVIKGKTYKFRVKRYISDYLVKVVADNSTTNQLTEASFFSQPKTKKLLAEKAKVGEQTSRQFMLDCLRDSVLSAMKHSFQFKLYDGGNIVKDRVFFRYEFRDYDLFLREQGMDFIGVLDSFNVVKSGFLYIENKALFSAAFFSKEIYDRMKADFLPFLKKNPKLSDVPFTNEFLSRSMYEQGALSPYISKDALDLLVSKRELFEDEFISLYGGVANTNINRYIEEGKLDVLPNPNDSKKITYSLKHEDENGIIEGEYGMSSEQHRVNFDVDVSDQLDDMEGCPM